MEGIRMQDAGQASTHHQEPSGPLMLADLTTDDMAALATEI
jgi:hypothetical protein